MSEKKSHLVAIVGPTAVGKTSLAVRIAPRIGAEIISADSRQVYRGMDIGTGKETDKGHWIEINHRPTLQIEGAHIHGLNLADPDQPFSVADWRQAVMPVIDEISDRRRVPLVVGGTGLYFAALEGNIGTIQTPPDQRLRQEAAGWSTVRLQQEAQTRNPGTWRRLTDSDRHNPIRLIRAIETAGTKESSLRPLAINYLGVTRPRAELFRMADERVDRMLKLGLVEETRTLLSVLGPHHQSMTGIGYLEISAYLRDEIDLDAAVQRIKFRIHRYIRRQETWWRKKDVVWTDASRPGWQATAERLVRGWLQIRD